MSPAVAPGTASGAAAAAEPGSPMETAPTGVRRWGAYLALVVVFAIACGLLSWWQWERRAETISQGQLVTENYEAAPVAIGRLLPRLDSWRSGEEWRPIELHGRYLRDKQLLVRNRPYNANPGFEVLVPFQLDDGSIFVVDRGWLSIGDTQDAPDVVPAAPAGEVTVVARLQQGEPVFAGRTAPAGQIPEINLPTVAKLSGTPTTMYTGAYGLLDTESPAAATRPRAADEPVVDEGPHLSYAIQWIAFALLAFFGLFWAFRRERRINALPTDQQASARAPRLRSSDTDAEDAILDRAGLL